VYQGKRGPVSTAPFRVLGRFVWYPLDQETGFFYSGTNLGARRIVALGASVDHQGNYNTRGADLYVDVPVTRGDAATFQLNVIRYDGGSTLTTLPQQTCWMAEGGYYLHTLKVEPFVQVASRDPRDLLPAERKYLCGLAYWGNGHRYNVKVGLARMTRAGAPNRTQLQVQGQLFMW
jgi:hypothetical protein